MSRGEDLMAKADTQSQPYREICGVEVTFIRYGRQVSKFSSEFLDTRDFANSATASQDRFP